MLHWNAAKRYTRGSISLLHSKIRRLPPLRSRAGVSLLGVAALVVTPGAVLAVNSLTNNSSSGPSLSSSSSTESSGSAETSSNQGVSASTSVNTSVNSDGQTNTTTEITVNGEPVTVPENGELHKTIQTENGEVKVDVSNGSTSNTYTNSTNVQMVNTNSSSSSTIISNQFNSSQ